MVDVSAIHVHPQWDNSKNDIALVMLSEPVDASITPAKLPLAYQSPEGGSAVTFVD